MSHHYNTLRTLKSTLINTMMSCWREGRKLLTDNPHDAEIYFTVGETCHELIKTIQDELEKEASNWHQ